MKKNILLFLLLVIVSAACSVSPNPIIKLDYINTGLVKLWIEGKENIEVPDGKFKYIVAFDHMEDGRICFNVSVLNNSDKVRIIDHYLFRINYSNEEMDNPNTTCFAIDPDRDLINIDKNISREKARYGSELATDALFGFFDFVGSFSEKGQRTEAEIKQEEIDDLEDEIDRLENEQNHMKRMNELRQTRNFHEQTALQKTSLLPGHTISGKIYFPYLSGYQYVRLKIDGGQTSVNYKISEIPVYRY